MSTKNYSESNSTEGSSLPNLILILIQFLQVVQKIRKGLLQMPSYHLMTMMKEKTVVYYISFLSKE